MKIALIRHPRPSIEPGICYGRLDMALDPSTQDQIGRLAAATELLGAARLWTSPARRCRMLADAIALELAAPVTIDPRLQELDFGEWEGRSWDEIARSDLDQWAASPLTFAPPGGETGATLIKRVRDVHADLVRDQQDCAIISHGGPLKVLTALLLGMPVDLLVAAPPMGSIRIVAVPPG